MRAQIGRLLERESQSDTPLRPALLEASFTEDEESDRGPLDLGGLRIHGQIDRVDTTPDSLAAYRWLGKLPVFQVQVTNDLP